jgi:hypothetical protein
MVWRIIVFSLLALGPSAAPVTARTQRAGFYQTFPVTQQGAGF